MSQCIAALINGGAVPRTLFGMATMPRCRSQRSTTSPGSTPCATASYSESSVGPAQKMHKLAHAFWWEHGYNRLKLAQLLGRHGVLRTFCTIG